MTVREPLLEVRDLSVEVPTREGALKIVDAVSFTVGYGETLGIVGESGSGKSLTARAVLRILANGRISSGSVKLAGRELTELHESQMRSVRGRDIGMVFQEPMTALDPAYTVGEQIAETIRVHRGVSRKAAWQRAVRILDQVQIPSAEQRAKDYPHNFSGGMRQRVVLAMALSCEPKLLLADEPTTALDVTTQAQILTLLKEIQSERELGVLFISHDLGVMADIADSVCVMYAGQIVEHTSVFDLFRTPKHPYTSALMNAVPRGPGHRLEAIPGMVPEFSQLPTGCRFAPRCSQADVDCHGSQIALESVGEQHLVRCVRPIFRELQVVTA